MTDAEASAELDRIEDHVAQLEEEVAHLRRVLTVTSAVLAVEAER